MDISHKRRSKLKGARTSGPYPRGGGEGDAPLALPAHTVFRWRMLHGSAARHGESPCGPGSACAPKPASCSAFPSTQAIDRASGERRSRIPPGHRTRQFRYSLVRAAAPGSQCLGRAHGAQHRHEERVAGKQSSGGRNAPAPLLCAHCTRSAGSVVLHLRGCTKRAAAALSR